MIAPDRREASPADLPEGLVAYKRTEEFTAKTVPAGLRKDHCTKAGVWGLIHVTAGRLCYRVTDRRRAAHETVLTPDIPGIVEPTMLHNVEPLDEVRFFVEFWRQAPEPLPLCRHEELAREENRARAAGI